MSRYSAFTVVSEDHLISLLKWVSGVPDTYEHEWIAEREALWLTSFEEPQHLRLLGAQGIIDMQKLGRNFFLYRKASVLAYVQQQTQIG